MLTPLQCLALLRFPETQDENTDLYGGRFYPGFRGLLGLAMRRRWLIAHYDVNQAVTRGAERHQVQPGSVTFLQR
ncbi:hypothetical protein NKDENANG_02739 [Candidatus Entotheonellaceae bacterium PAL068K]